MARRTRYTAAAPKALACAAGGAGDVALNGGALYTPALMAGDAGVPPGVLGLPGGITFLSCDRSKGDCISGR